ncbi:hypothetical protein BN1708_010550, partial [Verticillium longisporum]
QPATHPNQPWPQWFHDKSLFALSGPGFLNEALGMHQGHPGRIQRPSIATMQVAREKQMVAGHNKDEDYGTKMHFRDEEGKSAFWAGSRGHRRQTTVGGRRNQRMGKRQDIMTGVPGRAPPRQGADAWRLLPSPAPAARKQEQPRSRRQ